MKKVLPLLMLASTCLASCGETSVYGKYQFLLGRQGKNETRINLEMELKDEASKVKEGYKTFEAKFELSGLVEDEEEESSNIFSILGSLSSLFSGKDNSAKNGDPISFPGYYKVSDLSDAKYGNKVKIGFDLGETINKALSDLGIDPTEIIQHFVVSYCNGSDFTLQLPVSLDDIQMQLAWYGIYIDYDPYVKARVNTLEDLVRYFTEGKISFDSIKSYKLTDYLDKKLPGEQNFEIRYGSHPTIELNDKDEIVKNEIYDMNEKYQGLFSNTFVYANNAGEKGEKIGTIYKEISEENSYYFFPLNDYVPSVTGVNSCFIKEDQGTLDYDFSLEKELNLYLTAFTENDGSVSYMVSQMTSIAGETADKWNWKRFYQKPFEFRDYHDIKIGLKKE